MAFENPTNRGRAEKAVDLIDKIKASAESNRTSDADLAEMLAPIFAALGMRPAETATTGPQGDPAPDEAPKPAKALVGASAPIWANVRDFCDQIPASEISLAMNRLAIRVDELVDKGGS